MIILGIHVGHDSSAAIIQNGKIVADVAEERFTRIKHYSGLPINAVQFCLNYLNINIQDVDKIVVPAKGAVLGLNFLFDLKKNQLERKTKKRQLMDLVSGLMGKNAEKPPIYIPNYPISKNIEIVHVEHHLAHAASAYFTNPISEKQLVVTLDGGGDGFSSCIWEGKDGVLQPLVKYGYQGSLGWFYGNVTEALGWIHGDGEGKTMGLAPYGNCENVRGLLDKFCPGFKDGKLNKPHKFGRPYFWNDMSSLQWHFEESKEIKKIIEKFSKEQIAAEAQRILEREVFNFVLPWLKKRKIEHLSCSGGLFLNVKLNQRIWEANIVQSQHIYPNCGDSGLAVGAALYVYNKYHKISPININNLYWGPEYNDDEIKIILDDRKLLYKRVDNVEEYIAKKLHENKIIAWFQGRMESGPRALGNRSILMSPLNPENKNIINKQVKFRENFRPFCPSLLYEKRKEYLENSRDEFFMITSFTCKKEKIDKIPAVVHKDNTMRPQLVKKDVNPRYWKLINEFGRLTGEYIILNTSLNIKGEPMINHPREAIRCFYDNGLDYLVMGNYVLSKE